MVCAAIHLPSLPLIPSASSRRGRLPILVSRAEEWGRSRRKREGPFVDEGDGIHAPTSQGRSEELESL